VSEKKSNFPPYFKWAALVFLATWAVILASAFGLNIFPRTPNFERTGQFGDSFGVLNAIMASFAAISAFAAYQAQREELDRLRATESKREAFAYKRDFESTFFNLLNLLRETVKEIDVDVDHVGAALGSKGDVARGRDAMAKILDRLDESDSPTTRKNYQDIYADYRDDLGHYFRTFYHIARFIDESDIQNKMTYIRLLRATLSNAEIVLIGLNCIHGGGEAKLKPLVEKYALLHNVSSQFAEKWELTTQFASTAFGDRRVSLEGKLGS
jgi:Putative phage abortive infection protein